jgi:plasmid stability protein
VAVPVYGGEPLDTERPRQLLQVSLSSETRTESEVREALTDALATEGLEVLLENAVEARRRELVVERRKMREQMEQQEDAQAAEWLRGIDDLSPGSFDLLALMVLYPG